MARKRRTDLDREISRLQKNTRNKLYRLRVKGARSDEIDPRRSTRNMNGAQKAAYARELQAFNSRGNSFIVQENKVPVKTADVKQYLEIQAKLNIRREMIRERVDRLSGITPNEMPIESRANLISSYDAASGRFIRRRGALANDLLELNRNEPFGSQAKLESAIKSLKQQARKQNYSRSNKQIRENIKGMLNSTGMPRFDDAVDGLNNAQLNYLLYRTDFMEKVAMVANTNEDYDTNPLEQANLEMYASFMNTIVDYMREVKVITNRYTIRK